MPNKYIAALAATLVFGVLFPLIYHVLTQQHLRPLPVALSATVFFFAILALCARVQRGPRPG